MYLIFIRFCIKCYDQLTKYLRKNGVEVQTAISNNIISLPIY